MNSQEYYLGHLLSDDNFFKVHRQEISPERYSDLKIAQILSIIKESGNNIEAIFKIDRQLAIYSMDLCNKFMANQITQKVKK